jgi:hypothetical protein
MVMRASELLLFAFCASALAAAPVRGSESAGVSTIKRGTGVAGGTARRLLDRGEWDGGDDGGDDDEGGGKGTGVPIPGTSSGCTVNLGGSSPAFSTCLQYKLGGQKLQLAYTVVANPSGGGSLLQGALLAPGATSSRWISVGLPSSGTRMLGTSAVFASTSGSSARAAAYKLSGYSMASFSPTSDFLYNQDTTLVAAVAGNALVSGFSIILPSR